jgi:hypothetical protein
MGYQDSMNLYQAFGMNPVNFVDPMGLSKILIKIIRDSINSNSVTGTFYVIGPKFRGNDPVFSGSLDHPKISVAVSGYTLERPWDENRRFRSCIPTGTYSSRMYNSPRFGQQLPIALGVPNRTHILIHAGRYPRNTSGCILVGSSCNPQANTINAHCTTNAQIRAKLNQMLAYISKVIQYDQSIGETTEIVLDIKFSLNLLKEASNFMKRYKSGKNELTFPINNYTLRMLQLLSMLGKTKNNLSMQTIIGLINNYGNTAVNSIGMGIVNLPIVEFSTGAAEVDQITEQIDQMLFEYGQINFDLK